MNREIKFRGKRVDNGKWIYGSLDVAYDGSMLISFWYSKLIEPENNYKEMVQEWHQVIPDSVGQFIGKIKTEQEVYEKDIILHGESVRFIEIRNGNTCATRGNKKETILLSFSENPSVIGNMIDNPELLIG